MKVKISHAQAVSDIQELDLSLETPRGKECVIGRSPDADFVLDDPDVSRFHCKFFYQSGHYYFSDLGSRNGSIVNNKLIQKNQPQLLSDGDVIRIGDYVLQMEDTASMDQPAETVVRIINPALFSKSPSSKNLESEKLEAVVDEVAAVNTDTPVVEEVKTTELQTTDEPEIITAETVNPAAAEVNEVEITTPQADVVISPQIEDEVVQTPVSESDNIDTPEIPVADIPVAETEDSQAFAVPEYTIVQPRKSVSEKPELISETPEDSSHYLQDDELVEETYVQQRNQEKLSTKVEELPTSETEEIESEVTVADDVETPTISELETPTISEDNYTITQATEEEEVIKSSSETKLLEDMSTVNIVSTPESEEVSPVEESQAEETLETTSESQLPTVVTQKYTVLIAHESKQSELVNFVKKHQELLSACLTMTWNSVSKSLEEQVGVSVSEEIPAATSGGYQRIAALINSDEILAVIFLRDLLQPQPGQANEETFLRLCNINQVLLATNLPTAEAVVCYMQHGL